MAIETSKRLNLNRRGFLKSVSVLALAGAAGLTTGIMPALAAGGDADAEHRFFDFSQFITGQILDPVLSARYLKALSDADPKFAPALDSAIAATANFKDLGIDAMLKSLDPNSAVRATILTVTSAWYLGTVGDGKAAKLVAFYDALMFKPTWDAVFVPTYGGGPNSWVGETHL